MRKNNQVNKYCQRHMFSVLAIATQILANVNAATTPAPDFSNDTLTTPVTPINAPQKLTYIRIPGDIIIGGVFPVHSKSSNGDDCGEIAETRGVHRVEAMLYALDMINAQKDFLRGLKLGALILDSCSNPAFALNQSLEFVRDMIGSSDAKDYTCSDGKTPQISAKHRDKKSVAAVVGGSYSSVSVQLANLLRLFRIAQVSPASTNADLSDKSRFEYFARTVPSDNYQAMAMVSIAKKFNWTYVSLVFSADEYGELGADAFKQEARKHEICIAIEARITLKDFGDKIDAVVDKLQPDKEYGARVVVLFVGTEYIPIILSQTATRMKLSNVQSKKKIIWLASESWDRNNEKYTAGDNRWAAENAIVLMLASQKVPPFEEYFKSLNPGTPKFKRNGWLRELWQVKHGCQFDLPEKPFASDGETPKRCEEFVQIPEEFKADDKVQFVIDAVYAIAHGLEKMRSELCPPDEMDKWFSRNSAPPTQCQAMQTIDGRVFYRDYLTKVKFKNIVGRDFEFKKNGDGPGSYTILTYRPRDKRKRGSADNNSDYVEIGNWTYKGENPDGTHNYEIKIYDDKLFWNNSSKPPLSVCSLPCERGYKKQLIKDEQCCWACSKCDDNEFLVGETHCEKCALGWWPNKTRTGCYDIAKKDLQHMEWSSWNSIIPTILAVIGICATLFVIVVYVMYNETPVVKASGRELSYVLLIAMVMCYTMTFILLSKPTATICAIKRTGIGFAFSCLYSAMFVKTNRIYRIFNNKTAQRPRYISPISQVVMTSMLAGLQLFGSFVWLIIVPPATRHSYPTIRQVVLTCNVPDHHFLYSLAYDGVLIVLCTVYAVKTRKVPENFNETKFIGFSMYTTCVVWLSWIFFFFGTTSNFQIQTASLCVSISMSANVALVCIFSPKLWIILFEKHKNVRKQEGESMLNKSSRSLGNCSTRLCANSIDEPNQYTALLSDSTRRRASRKTSQPTSTSSAQDTFL
ncbi:unnamed protein product [Caenorhabditis angaria]|uniref:G-protein coupled receptors family 3 profile domain-containing protein n=1 Tax=Caenorhabditis angaria TaxID=860376 RepID=A0A9P1IXV6_9PELO|nr:unnamed protein product [Caenorhabditis angaria]